MLFTPLFAACVALVPAVSAAPAPQESPGGTTWRARCDNNHAPTDDCGPLRDFSGPLPSEQYICTQGQSGCCISWDHEAADMWKNMDVSNLIGRYLGPLKGCADNGLSGNTHEAGKICLSNRAYGCSW